MNPHRSKPIQSPDCLNFDLKKDTNLKTNACSVVLRDKQIILLGECLKPSKLRSNALITAINPITGVNYGSA